MSRSDEGPLSSSRHGCAPEQRDIQEHLRLGLVIVDKPRGPTSHQVSAWVRNMLGAKKAGHGGTLDPNVSGVLPIALNDGLKALQVLLLGTKEYIAIMKLHASIPKNELEQVFSRFTGDVYQLPPVRSAVKRELRVRRIHEIKLLETHGTEVLFRVECESGTYIRTLCKDMGDALAVGGHMLELRRTRSAQFKESDAHTLHELKDAQVGLEEGDEGPFRRMVLPFERLLDPLPKLVIKDSAVDAVCHGADVAVPGIVRITGTYQKGETVAVLSQKGEGVAVGQALCTSTEALGKEKGAALKLKRVLMEPGTYPALWKKGDR